MRIAHLADLHYCREYQSEAMKSIRHFTEYIKIHPVDMVAISGDSWDASVLNTEASGFMGFVDAIRDIANIAPVAMIYGTPSHDTDGSLEIFRKINSKYSITILEPAQAYVLEKSEGGYSCIVNAETLPNTSNAKLLLFGIPEPRKKYLLADNTLGKDELESALRNSMQKICFLLAAKRREHPALPCVMLYHGDLAGSKLQNDQTIERGTGIAITVDDLASIGAEYYALGHIHKPQQVGSLPAYYAGSIYPKNFGECHQAAFNIVEIDGAGKQARVESVPFPHPQNMKIERIFAKGQIDEVGDVVGKKVWLEIECGRDEMHQLDEEALLKSLLQKGAVEGSRVTITTTAVETVRAAEITSASDPCEKAKLWAENSGVELNESVLKKIIELDAEISKDSAKAHGAWELVSLKLRGAKGIKKGIHKDEIAVNFDDYDSGLIALTGENGKGKTTLIENCLPYPQLLTRKGKLQDHFCLRDSYREVVYRDRDSGKMIKCFMQIDGATKSGSCKYFAYDSTDGGETWNALPGIDGNVRPYEDFIVATFGTLELFLRTAFITQRPTKNLPDLTDATVGEKKTLFVELAGIDYLQKFADAASEKSKQNGQAAHDAEIKIQMLESAIAEKQELEKRVADERVALSANEKELETVTEDGKIARENLNNAKKRADAERERTRQEKDIQLHASALESEIASLERERERNDNAAMVRTENEKLIKQWESLQNIISVEETNRNSVNEQNAASMSAYLSQKEEFNRRVSEIEKERDELCTIRQKTETEIEAAKTNIKWLEKDAAEITDSCPTCGQLLPADKIAVLENKRKETVSKIDAFQKDIDTMTTRLAEIVPKIAALTENVTEIMFEEPSKPTPLKFNDAALNEAKAKQSAIDINRARSELDMAKSAAVRIEELDKQIADKKKQSENAEREKVELIAKKDDGAEAALDLAQRNLDALTERYTSCKAGIAASTATIEGLEKTIQQIVSQESQLASTKKEAAIAKEASSEWELVVKAFGRDGIQALELDALAPGISETANHLLESAYGDRFRIDIETTRIGGSGKKTRQIEDFKIMVTDSEDGESTALENKSGGEAVWIKRAIYDAFAVIRRRNTGFAFLTCFQDETDGALDASAKTAYCRMLEASHAAAKLRHTVIITHSNEVKAMIEQKIEMERL